jgi:putative FmdB family regulatory protein
VPTYEYQCQKCGHRFSEFQRIVDPPIKDCPRCRKKSCVEQIISGGSGLVFKGSGFYITDYKRKPTSGSDSGSAGSGTKESGAKDSGSKETTAK